MERPAEKARALHSGFKVLVRDSTVYALGRIALSALDLLLLPVYTRVLLPDEFGRIAIATAFMAVVTVLSPFGLDAALGRFYFDHEEGGRQQRAMTGTLAIGIAVVAFVIACGMSFAGPHLDIAFLGDLSPQLLLILVWTAFFGVFATLWLQLLQLRRQPGRYVAFACGHAVIRGGLTLLFVWGLSRGAVGWGAAYLITNVVVGLIAIVLIRREISLIVQLGVLKDALKYALPVVLHQVAGWTTTYASRFILNHFATLRAVGVFQVAFGIGQVLSLMVTAYNFAYAPRFMAAATQDSEKASVEFGAMATYYLASVIGVALLVSLFAQEIVAVAASKSYMEAAHLVPIVAATFVLQGAYYLQVNAIFFSKMHTRALPIITVGGAAVTVVVTYVLVPRFGIFGAAWGGLAANVLVVCGAYFLGRRALRIRYDTAKIGLISLAAVVLVTISEWASTLSPHYYQRLLLQAASVLAYAAVLWLLGVISPTAIHRAARSLFKNRRDAD